MRSTVAVMACLLAVGALAQEPSAIVLEMADGRVIRPTGVEVTSRVVTTINGGSRCVVAWDQVHRLRAELAEGPSPELVAAQNRAADLEAERDALAKEGEETQFRLTQDLAEARQNLAAHEESTRDLRESTGEVAQYCRSLEERCKGLKDENAEQQGEIAALREHVRALSTHLSRTEQALKRADQKAWVQARTLEEGRDKGVWMPQYFAPDGWQELQEWTGRTEKNTPTFLLLDGQTYAVAWSVGPEDGEDELGYFSLSLTRPGADYGEERLCSTRQVSTNMSRVYQKGTFYFQVSCSDAVYSVKLLRRTW